MGPRVGRPQTRSYGWLNMCVSYALIGLVATALAAVCAALATLAGVL